MSEVQIYHNPRCRKSREALELLREKGEQPQIREYLKQAPTIQELRLVLAKLNKPVHEIIRTEEQIYKDKYKGLNFNEAEWIQILIENPILIQRPIVLRKHRGVVARPPQLVDTLY